MRQKVSREQDPAVKARLGQYLTPSRIANFMASLFDFSITDSVRLLDAGAGIGSLSAAFFERLLEDPLPRSVQWCGYEIDKNLAVHLRNKIDRYAVRLNASGINFEHDLKEVDFVEDAVKQILFRIGVRYNFAILNPPYKKINANSRHRLLLRETKIETVNLYTGFLALVINLLAPGGQVVAIVPRSFCNGPYYKPFRNILLNKTSIRHIHLFGSRDKAFKDDQVLQENLIIHLERAGTQGNVTISTSTDDTFGDYKETVFSFEHILDPGDAERFIHIPTTSEFNPLDHSHNIHSSLDDLGLMVSTGPVVDFRVAEHLRSAPEPGTVPLLYPGHFIDGRVEWPKLGKKPNALVLNDHTRPMLYPNGYYVVVRRLSSKEEHRRIIASVVEPCAFETEFIALENHLNVFHTQRNGLHEDIAYGLCLYLNSSFIDNVFRRFSGHTQVNATDLRLLKYPPLEVLRRLGAWAKKQTPYIQESIDEEVNRYV